MDSPKDMTTDAGAEFYFFMVGVIGSVVAEPGTDHYKRMLDSVTEFILRIEKEAHAQVPQTR